MEISELHKLFTGSNGISTDTRKLVAGTLFFALKGANFNGNTFALQALQEGCSYAIVDEVDYAKDESCILVEDVLLTLQQLANYHRKQFTIPVLGITGSNGKTTTKELIGAVLKKKFNVLVTAGNLNNHLGVPFTLLGLKQEHDFAIIEMGASKPGDIRELADIAEPTHGIITNIGAAHIEGFGSLQGVVETKTELYRFIEKAHGVLFYNCEDEVLVNRLPQVQTVSYGENDGHIQGQLVEMNPFVCFKWKSPLYESQAINTKLVGRYNFTNFLVAVTIGDYFGVQPDQINQALEEYAPANNRSQIQKTDRNTLIVDCYNANATSMKAAIESFAEMNAQSKLAILGDMLELGDISEEEHQQIVDLLVRYNINAILVGKEFSKTKHPFDHYMSASELIATEKLQSLEKTLVLLKGSRGIKLETIVPIL